MDKHPKLHRRAIMAAALLPFARAGSSVHSDALAVDLAHHAYKTDPERDQKDSDRALRREIAEIPAFLRDALL